MYPVKLGTRIIVKAQNTNRFGYTHNKKFGYDDLVGGQIEPNETFDMCAYRETVEELASFPCRPFVYIKDFSYVYKSDGVTTFSGKLYYTEVESEYPCRSEDGYDLKWVNNFEDLNRSIYWLPYQKVILPF